MKQEKKKELKQRARQMSLDLLHRKALAIKDAIEIGDSLGYSDKRKMEVQCIYLKEVLDVLGTVLIERVSDDVLGENFVDSILKGGGYED